MKAKLWTRNGDTRIINKREGIELVGSISVDANYVAGCDEYAPAILVSAKDDTSEYTYDRFNYIQIGDAELDAASWKDKRKYYFITGIKSLGKRLYRFDLALDSLTTYQYELTHQKFIVDRNSKHFNMYISDNAQYARTYPIIYSKKFDQGFSDSYEYVLSTVGKEV